MEQEFSVEQGYAISLFFFFYLWDLVKSDVMLLGGDAPSTHELFFHEVCSGYEASAEWNEAVFRVKKIPKISQRNLQLTEKELFLCAIEFCKLHDERWESRLNYTVQLLEKMKKDPKHHQTEWTLWKKAKEDFMTKRFTFCDFNWSAELP